MGESWTAFNYLISKKIFRDLSQYILPYMHAYLDIPWYGHRKWYPKPYRTSKSDFVTSNLQNNINMTMKEGSSVIFYRCRDVNCETHYFLGEGELWESVFSTDLCAGLAGMFWCPKLRWSLPNLTVCVHVRATSEITQNERFGSPTISLVPHYQFGRNRRCCRIKESRIS